MDGKRIKILLIEDNPGDVRLIEEILKQAIVARFELESAGLLFAGLKRLTEEVFDVLLLDLGLPDSQGLDTLTMVRAQAPGLPIVVLTGLADEEVGIKAVQEGAQDYLVKGQVNSNLLVRTIRHGIERKRMEEVLRKRDAQQALILKSLPMAFYTAETSGNFDRIWISEQVDRISGFPAENFIRKPVFWASRIHPDDRDRILKELDSIFDRGSFTTEYRWQNAYGSDLWFLDQAILVSDDAGKPKEIIGTWLDITERKKTEEKIKESLKEKEVLLSEIYHRVKNNMQIISSLLNLQAKSIRDKKYLEMFKDSQNRIQSMALVHEKLYTSENLASIDFKDYIKSLVEGLLSSSRGGSGAVALKVNTEDVSFGIDTAIPCGLIINELVTNSLKYAFPERRDGEIDIVLRKLETEPKGEYEMIVSDNGVGIPKGLDMRKTETLGLRLVINLAEKQLKGEVKLNRDGGTEFRIRFKEIKKGRGKGNGED